MKPLDFHSVGKYFAYDRERSNVIENTYFFQYLGGFNSMSKGKLFDDGTVYVIISDNDISFKLEAFEEMKNQKKQLLLVDLLTIPHNRDHHSFLDIESQLIREKRKDVKRCKKNKRSEKLNGTFEQVLYHFIEDLYIYQYFKECGNIQSIKSAFEYVPLLQAIIYKYVFDESYSKLDKHKKNRKSKWIIEPKLALFEDAYLQYSVLLSNHKNERLYRRGGWFLYDKSAEKYNDIDTQLYQLEKKFIKIKNKYCDTESIFDEPHNFGTILKRYGITHLMELTISKKLKYVFVGLLTLLIDFILVDIVTFNLYKEGVPENLKNFLDRGLKIFSILWLLYAILLPILFYIRGYGKYILKLIPGIFLPRLMIAIISGWLVFFSAEELLKIDLNIGTGILLLISISILVLTIVFMIFEINNYAPAMKFRNIFYRSLVVCGLAFVVSYTFGFYTMSYINKKLMSIDSFVVNEADFFEDYGKREKEHRVWLKQADSIKRILQSNKELDKKNTISFTKLKSISLSKIQLFKKHDSTLIAHIKILNDSIKSFDKTKKEREALILLCNDVNDAQNDVKSENYYFYQHLEKGKKANVNKQYLYPRVYDIYVPLNGKVKIVSFPNMLLTRALLAMFLGIFLQLVIQDKTITEPI